MPASGGPAMSAPTVREWQAVQAGAAVLNIRSPRATGSLSEVAAAEVDPAGVEAAAMAGTVAFPPVAPRPVTMIGRGGQPWLSTWLTQSRNAIRPSISA